MACTRGCVGTPICSALDICCIQFRQDCGSGCGGLASGYSRIEVDVTGALIVCSNVGGVCTCNEPAGACCSTLTPNLDGTWTHDDGIGNTTTLDVCELLRESNCTLQVTDITFVPFTAFGPAAIPASAAWTELTAPDCITVNNPSDEDMYVDVELGSALLEITNLAGVTENFEFQREFSVDGGATWILMPSNSIDLDIDPNEVREIAPADFRIMRTIPSGGTETYCYRALYRSVPGMANVQIFLQTQRLTIHGIAIPFVP